MYLVGSWVLFIVCCVHVDIDPLCTANEEICKQLNATKVPYILIYKRNEGLVTSFPCSPSKIQLLIDALHEHASPLNDDLSPSISEEPEFEQLLEGDDSIESKGSEMMDVLMPKIQQQSGHDSILSFEEFCKKHTTKKK